jgi:hypothetical protein
MDLSPEDSLRLNVMLANAVAVRIDEGINVVMCLSPTGSEARVQLNPNCRSDQYIRYVRELFSSHVMGSPGGYPVYLKRWTRMGQTSDARLDDLLMLGEKEAVVAVTSAAGLTDELAKRVWWAMPDSDNARRMLARDCVVSGEMGKILSEFLMEFLPFEESPGDIIESVKLVLQPGLISDEEKMDIWNRGKKKNVFQVGFLHAIPDSLPEQLEHRSDLDQYLPDLEALGANKNSYAAILRRLLSGNGQTFLATCRHILKRPANQDVVVSFLDAMDDYFSDLRICDFHYRSVEAIIEQVDAVLSGQESEMELNKDIDELLQSLPALKNELRAMLILAHTGVSVINPIFAVTDSVGSVMRKKIEPVSTPIVECLKVLQGEG